MEKHSVSQLSYLFSHLHLLSSYSFPSTLLSSNLSLLSASSLLCFSSVHIVGSLTSKLPSNIYFEHTLFPLMPSQMYLQSYIPIIYSQPTPHRCSSPRPFRNAPQLLSLAQRWHANMGSSVHSGSQVSSRRRSPSMVI